MRSQPRTNSELRPPQRVITPGRGFWPRRGDIVQNGLFTSSFFNLAKPLIERVERRINRWLDHGIGRVWVVAVSGGSDSVGLLRVLCQIAEPVGLSLSVAHLDHGVRGGAARGDATFVAELARSLGLPVDLSQWQPARAAHFESDARRARYDWLTQVARERGAGAVAVGHTRDDQAETILHRILRGTGPRGLAGIPGRRTLTTEPKVALVRPLLGSSRRGIRAFLNAIGQPFREDETNALMTRTRSRIRHDLLPKLAAEYNPAVDRALLRLGAISASLAHAIDRDASAAAQSAIISVTDDCLVLKHPFLQSSPRFLVTEILRVLWRRAGWPEGSMSAHRWRRLASLIRLNEIKPVVIGARVLVSSDGSFLVLSRSPTPKTSGPSTPLRVEIPLSIPGRIEVPWADCCIDAWEVGMGEVVADEVVDFDQVAGALYVRAAVPGDRFDPLGMGGKGMPLADFFRGRRVSPARRARTPLVCDQSGIVWVAGHRIAERVKETSRTERRVKFRLAPGGAAGLGTSDSRAADV
jgi:tRNA(Ile)-lysidine synthase